MAAVLDRYATCLRSFGATFWNPGFKTEKTAKQREKTGQKWARYGLRKRVRVADLFLMDRYQFRSSQRRAGLYSEESGDLERMFGEEYAAEMRGLAKAANVDLADVLLANGARHFFRDDLRKIL